MSVSDETTVDDIIWGGGGAKSAEWPQVGAWIGGPIQVKPKKYHAKEYVKGQPGGGKPKYTQSGEPVMGIKVDVQTTMRDPSDPKDDGVRRMHLDKWRQLEAVRHALQEAGVRGLEVGGELWVQWSGEEPDAAGGNAAKTWYAKYRPPHAVTEVPGGNGHMQQAPPMQAPQPVPQQAPQPQQQAWPPQQPVHHAAPGYAAPGYAQPAQQLAQPPMTPTGPPQQAYPGAGAAPEFAQAPQQPATQQPALSQQPQAPSQQPGNVITASVAASLQAQNIDTSGFTIVPG